MKLSKFLFIVFFLTFVFSPLQADESVTDERYETAYLILAADLSGSSSILTNDHFAKAVIARIKKRIMALKKGAWVEIKTFGDGSLSHIQNRKIRIASRGNTAEVVAELVATKLHEIRKEAGTGQSSTNLLAFWELENLHCDTGASHIYLLSDSIEHSFEISSEALLSGSQALPEPEEDLLSGCRVTLIGLGNVSTGLLPRAQRKNLEAAWRNWFEAAGVADLDIIYRP